MPELEQKQFQKRQIACKVRISDILNNNLVKDELSAGFIKLNDMNVSRVNIIATVVYKSDQESNYRSAIIDDGTGKILLRSFENADIFSKIDVGDPVIAIGKIREFNNEKYIIPEILKKMNNFEWVNVRKKELEDNKINADKDIKNDNESPVEEISTNINEEIYSLIKKLDNGDGVAIDDVIKNSKNNDVGEIINNLLGNGDIFEIRPGMIKVLE